MNGKKSIITLALCLGLAAVARADLTNGTFEAGLTGWNLTPDAQVGIQTDALGNFAFFQEIGGPGGQANSSIYQDFVISNLATVSFEYRITTAGQYDGSFALPDAFTARLLDPVTLQPILSTPGVNDFFYHDTRGMGDSLDFDSNFVTLEPIASRAEWSTVTLDLSSIASGTSARLQFDLLGTGFIDGQVTFAGVDNVETVIIPAPAAVLLGLIGLTFVRPGRA